MDKVKLGVSGSFRRHCVECCKCGFEVEAK